MVHRMRTAALLAILALGALRVGDGASAANDVPRAQAPADDHSYLPPWMQPQANAGQTSLQSQYLNAIDDPALKQKAQGQQPPQKPRKRHSSPFDMFF
jgi:hypothetical protein